MLAEEAFSLKVDLLRLHHQALQEKNLELPQKFETLSASQQIHQLLCLLISHKLKCFGFEQTINTDTDEFMLTITIPELGVLIDRACQAEIELGELHFPPPQSSQPYISFSYYENKRWTSTSNYLNLVEDLLSYQQLQTKELPKELDTSKEAQLKQNFFWLQQVSRSKSDQETQQDLVRTTIQEMVPSERVRVQQREGQSLQDAILSALVVPEQSDSSESTEQNTSSEPPEASTSRPEQISSTSIELVPSQSSQLEGTTEEESDNSLQSLLLKINEQLL